MIRGIHIKLLMLFLTAGFIYNVYHYFATPKQQMSHFHHAPAEVSVAKVVERDARQWKSFSGRLIPIEQVKIHPRVAGMIESIHFKDGAMVNKGDLLFTIDPRFYRAEAARAQGALASLTSQSNHALTELARAEKLIQQKVISQSEYDSRQNAFKVIQANIKSAKATLDAAMLNLEFSQVKAPISGKISRAEVTMGNLVEAGPHAALLATIVSSNPIYADFEVDENAYLQYAAQKATGMKDVKKIPVMMGLATEQELNRLGYIESFDNQLNTTSGTIRVRAVFENTDSLLVPGLFVRIKVGDPKESHTLLINDRAIGTDQNKKFVLVVGEDNLVAYREIKLGGQVDGLRVVNEGLKPGDKIIVDGLQRARPGQPAKPALVQMDAISTAQSIA